MDSPDFDLQALRTLTAVVDTGGFTAAAGVLHKTQAAVSATVAGLEQVAGCRLLERSRSGCRPTPQGAVLLGYARRVLGLLAEAAQAMEAARPPETVRLGVADECLATLAAAVAGRLAARQPQAVLEVRCDLSQRLEAALWAGELDAAVVVREPGSDKGTRLWCDPLVWCLPAGSRAHEARPVPVALFAEGCRTRPMVLAALEAAGLAYREVCRASHIAGLATVAASATALAALMRRAVPSGWRELASGEAGLPTLPPCEVAVLLPPKPTVLARLMSELLVGEREGGAEIGAFAATPPSITSAPA
ncbi:MAG: LysR family transcriptional regulator [Solidesulfovibrio sp. DCME]|uniref:LysR family transcriptional regulator n=1 Tax=Solidesulfovibrio sp. DCME TaxID=3447380 RepID=UPI003D0B9865